MLRVMFFALILVSACKAQTETEIKEVIESSASSEEEFDEISKPDQSANPFDRLDTVPGKLIMSGSFVQVYDDDPFNIGFSVFRSGDSAFLVHTILSQIVVDLSTGISKAQAVDPNDPEAIPMTVTEDENGVVYKSQLRLWPDTFIKTDRQGKITEVSFQKPVQKLVQDPVIELKDHSYNGQKARIMLDTDI